MHAVQLYHEETGLADALARFAAEGLAQGEGVVVIGSSRRWQALTERLRAGARTAEKVLARARTRM